MVDSVAPDQIDNQCSPRSDQMEAGVASDKIGSQYSFRSDC